MSSTRRLAILSKAGTDEGVAPGWRSLTHHEATTLFDGLLERRKRIEFYNGTMQRLVIRYHLTAQGKRYLEVMQTPIEVVS